MRTKLSRIVALPVILLLTATAFAAETDLIVGPDWSMSRVWKDARRELYHFYEGKLPLRNMTQGKMENVRAKLTIFNTLGEEINSSEEIAFGTLMPAQEETRDYIILRATGFSELQLKILYTVDGAEKSLVLSSIDAEVFELLQEPGEGGLQEIRVMGHEIDQPVVDPKKKKKKSESYSTLILRVRNLATVVAKKPTAKIRIRISDGKKKKSRSRRSRRSSRGFSSSTRSGRSRSSSHSSKSGSNSDEPNYEYTDQTVYKATKIDKDNAEVEVPIGGDLKSGETRIAIVKIDIPDYEAYQITISAEWPTGETIIEEEFVEKTRGTTSGDGQTLSIGAFEVIDEADGTQTLTVPVTNGGAPIQPDTLMVMFTFYDDKGTDLGTLEHLCAEAIPGDGTTTTVKISGQSLPEYSSYEVGIQF